MVSQVDSAAIDTAIVKLWGQDVGAVAWLPDRELGYFEFEPAFVNSGLDISPIHMGLEKVRDGHGPFAFGSLNRETFLGLPGLLADALPDKFGNRIIDAWLARQGRDAASFSPVERLCYTGKRGMGALEFSPAVMDKYDEAVAVEIAELVELAQEITQSRNQLDVQFTVEDCAENGANDQQDNEAILDILRVGTSAGGARPKAVIAMNEAGHVIAGQSEAPAGYDYWLLKFDGVTDLELGEPKGYGRIEYAYYLMANAAGISMAPSRLLEENGRAHFMTRRFDRGHDHNRGQKRHMQTLCGIAHYDFNMAGSYSYEQAFMIMRQLRLSKAEAEQQYRRMLFNVIARDLDDHTKNIAFLMDEQGKWSLSPAYDVIYAHNPKGQWTSQHQMSINGKRDDFTRQDLISVGESISLSRPEDILQEVTETVSRWPEFAKEAGINQKTMDEIHRHQRLAF